MVKKLDNRSIKLKKDLADIVKSYKKIIDNLNEEDSIVSLKEEESSIRIYLDAMKIKLHDRIELDAKQYSDLENSYDSYDGKDKVSELITELEKNLIQRKSQWDITKFIERIMDCLLWRQSKKDRLLNEIDEAISSKSNVEADIQDNKTPDELEDVKRVKYQKSILILDDDIISEWNGRKHDNIVESFDEYEDDSDLTDVESVNLEREEKNYISDLESVLSEVSEGFEEELDFQDAKEYPPEKEEKLKFYDANEGPEKKLHKKNTEKKFAIAEEIRKKIDIVSKDLNKEQKEELKKFIDANKEKITLKNIDNILGQGLIASASKPKTLINDKNSDKNSHAKRYKRNKNQNKNKGLQY